MTEVQVSGQLVCRNREEALIVIEHLADHVALTRAEPGCLSFEVRRVGDSLVWQVEERFTDAQAFSAHQRRTRASEWGRLTSGIDRRYVTGETPPSGQ